MGRSFASHDVPRVAARAQPALCRVPACTGRGWSIRCRSVHRDRGLAVEPEPPRVCRGVTARSRHPDTGAGADARRRRTRERTRAKATAATRHAGVEAGLLTAQGEGRREAGRPARPVAARRSRRGGPRRASSPATTSPARSRTALAAPGRAAHDVGAPVHAVGEVDVEVAGRAEHHLGARGRAAEGVRPGVARPGIRLDLGEPHRDAGVA